MGVLDDDAGFGGEGGDEGAEDADAVGVGPVVELRGPQLGIEERRGTHDGSEEIHVCILDGLRREEVVRHVRDSVFEFVGAGVAASVGGGFEVLHDEREVGEGGGELVACEAFAAADVDDGCFAERGPVVRVHDVGGRSERGESFHCEGHCFSAFGVVGGELGEHREAGIVGEGPTLKDVVSRAGEEGTVEELTD